MPPLAFALSSAAALNFAGRLLGPVAMFLGLYVIGRIIRRIATRAVVRAKGDEQVRALVHNAVTVATIIIALLSACVVAGLNVNVLLTFGGLTGVAIGLAFQNLLQNILSGMFILLERPFRLGDSITISISMNPTVGVTGVVQAITLRTTTLQMASGEVASVPNLLVFSNLVVINTARDRRRQSFDVRVLTQEEVPAMIEHITVTLPSVRGVETKPAPAIRAEPFVDGGFLVKCTYWVNSRKFDIDAVVLDVSAALWGGGGGRTVPKDDVVAPA